MVADEGRFILPGFPETSGGIHCVTIQQGMLQQDTLQ